MAIALDLENEVDEVHELQRLGEGLGGILGNEAAILGDAGQLGPALRIGFRLAHQKGQRLVPPG